LIEMKLDWHSFAIALASKVFPQPVKALQDQDT